MGGESKKLLRVSKLLFFLSATSEKYSSHEIDHLPKLPYLSKYCHLLVTETICIKRDCKRKQEAPQQQRGGGEQEREMGDEEMEDLSTSEAISTSQASSGGSPPISDLAVFLLEDEVW